MIQTLADRERDAIANRIEADRLQRKLERLLPVGDYSRMVQAVAAAAVIIDTKVLATLLDRADRVS